MANKETTGLSREMIFHPGETLKEVLEEKNMNQNELALRTGVSSKHISTVLNGEKSISVTFAKKLEYALGIEAAFWINLQTNYDKELLEFNELHSITKEENQIYKTLKPVVEWFIEKKYIVSQSMESRILDLRKLMGVSDLSAMRSLAYNGAYRAQTSVSIDSDTLFAWQRICELMSDTIEITDQSERSQKEKLQELLPKIKACMFLPQEEFIQKLQSLFAQCGIAFSLVPSFKGAPVQGFIKKTEQGRTVICMTFRQKRADIFWFTLFHEIAHFLNGDGKQKFIDFESVPGVCEAKADLFARNQLINDKEYAAFTSKNDFSLQAINKFAKQQKVLPCIVIGRLQKDTLIKWNEDSEEIVRYV